MWPALSVPAIDPHLNPEIKTFKHRIATWLAASSCLSWSLNLKGLEEPFVRYWADSGRLGKASM
jgi:hypothetical protein